MAKKKFKLKALPFIPLAILGIILLIMLLILSKNFLLSQTLEKSTATLSIQGSNLKIVFDIADKDKQKALKISKSLGSNLNWTEGIQIELDKNSLEWIENKSPKLLYIKFDDSAVSLSTGPVYALNNALPQEKINFSTGSGKLTLVRKRNGDFSLTLKSPKDILLFATQSGKLSISKKMEDLFPLILKIDTMYITLQEKTLKGRISLLD